MHKIKYLTSLVINYSLSYINQGLHASHPTRFMSLQLKYDTLKPHKNTKEYFENNLRYLS